MQRGKSMYTWKKLLVRRFFSSNHLRALWLLSILLLSFAYSVHAQGNRLGDEGSRLIAGAGHDYIHGLSETVNPANGSLSIKIALPTPKGRGISFPFALTYN